MRVAVALPSLWPDALHRVALDRAIVALGRSGVDVECFAESPRLRESRQPLPTYHYLRLGERHRAMPFDTALYPLGRDHRPYEAALLMSRQLAGLVWVLDPVLHHLVVGGMVLRGRADAYWSLSEERFGATTAVAVQTLATSWATPAFYRQLDPVPLWLSRQPRLVAATTAIAASWPAGEVSDLIELPLVEPDAAAAAGDERLTVVSMNYNRPEPLLRGLRALLEQQPQLKVVAFAPILTHRYLLQPCAALVGGLEPVQWRLTTEWGDMHREVVGSSIVAFLREDLTVGERTLLNQCLAAGKRVLTLRTRHYEAYPEGAVLKIEPGGDMRASLPGMCREILEDAELATAVQQRARQHVAAMLDARAVAEQLVEHLEVLAVTPAEWSDIAAPARRDLARRLGHVTLPVNASESSRRLIQKRLEATLGARWAARS